MGPILCPWAPHLGATVIGTVTSPTNSRRRIPVAETAKWKTGNLAHLHLNVFDLVHPQYRPIGSDVTQEAGWFPLLVDNPLARGRLFRGCRIILLVSGRTEAPPAVSEGAPNLECIHQ